MRINASGAEKIIRLVGRGPMRVPGLRDAYGPDTAKGRCPVAAAPVGASDTSAFRDPIPQASPRGP